MLPGGKSPKAVFLMCGIYEPRHEKTCLGYLRPGRLKLACSTTETSLGLEISAIASKGIILFRLRTTKAQIRLR